MESLETFFSYCDEISTAYSCSLFCETGPVWTAQKQALYHNGVIIGLYKEHNERLFSLITQPCDHKELMMLLQNEVACARKKQGHFIVPKSIDEPLLEWIANYDYCLASPMCNSREELLSYAFSEQALSYVYICLSYKRWEKTRNEKRRYDGEQPNIDALYKNIFDKSSVFGKWGLIPVDETRKLNSIDNPARIYDSSLNKTICISMPRLLADVLNELKTRACINDMAVQAQDSCIYDGECHRGFYLEEVERGKTFSWRIDSLPEFTKLYIPHTLYNENFNGDCLWVKSEGKDITFEELHNDFYDDGDNVVTQVIHLQHDGKLISHLDHEYIFYDIESYEARISNPNVKGEAKKRVKTFKIDNSRIPMDYPCKTYKDSAEISVPFIFFVLDNYFEHKDLLEEYFQEIMQKQSNPVHLR